MEKVDEARQACEHDWRVVGFQERSPLVIAVVYACEKCSSWTYCEMQFIGYRMESLEDKIAERMEALEDKIAGVTEGESRDD